MCIERESFIGSIVVCQLFSERNYNLWMYFLSCLVLSSRYIHPWRQCVVVIVDFVCPFPAGQYSVVNSVFFFFFILRACVHSCFAVLFVCLFVCLIVYLLMSCDCLASTLALDFTYQARASETWMRVCIFHSFVHLYESLWACVCILPFLFLNREEPHHAMVKLLLFVSIFFKCYFWLWENKIKRTNCARVFVSSFRVHM